MRFLWWVKYRFECVKVESLNLEFWHWILRFPNFELQFCESCRRLAPDINQIPVMFNLQFPHHNSQHAYSIHCLRANSITCLRFNQINSRFFRCQHKIEICFKKLLSDFTYLMRKLNKLKLVVLYSHRKNLDFFFFLCTR